ncbi:MAG: hypothetical protein HKN33_03085, partial [Pyrinomonadaceae bacterium]|nr:hypothetical protein [Pyrinomonadaceae bacterium]
ESGMDLDWFFEVYFRQPKLPELEIDFVSRRPKMKWKTPGKLSFPMPVEVEINGTKKRIIMKAGKVDLPKEVTIESFDPDGWILMKKSSIVQLDGARR